MKEQGDSRELRWALIWQCVQMHSSFLPFAVLAEPLLSVAVKLFFACCACICAFVCVCLSALTLTCFVSLRVQTKIIQCSAWECIHTLCLECQSAKLYLVNEQEGRCVCRSHWKENMNLAVCSPCAVGARGGLQRENDRVGAFKSPPALLPKLILLYHRPCFINLSNLEVNKLGGAAFSITLCCISDKVFKTVEQIS